MALKKVSGGPSPDIVEMQRVCLLPIWQQMDSEDHEVFCAMNMLSSAFIRGDRFRQHQAEAIRVFQKLHGGIFPLGVGDGKTGVSIACAEYAHKNLGVRRSLLMMPPSVCPQFEVAVRFWRERIPMSAASFRYLHRQSREQRAALVKSDSSACFVMPYSLLSQPDAMEMLAAIQPQLVICDEAHMLKNARAARTKRLMHWLHEISPMFVAMSASFTKKSLMEYQHMVVLALGENSPLPRTASMTYFWNELIQASAQEAPPQLNYVMRPLLEWAKQNWPREEFPADQVETYRRAYRHRFITAPGVVASGDNQIDCSLTVQNTPTPTEPTPELTALIRQVEEKFVTPNGDEIDHAIHVHKWTSELSAGFWNKLAWPTPEYLARYRGWSESESKEKIAQAQEHHAVLQLYHRELRNFLKDSPAGLDTPREVARAIAAGDISGMPDELVGLYRAHRAMETEGMVERIGTPIRVCDFKIRQTVEWAKARGRGLIWVWHKEMGRWITEACLEAGLDVVAAPAGENELFLQPATYDRVVVASIAAHQVGKNMQGEVGRGFNEQFVVQWPRDASVAEQMIGRTHRQGQKEDEVIVHTCRTSNHDHLSFAACLNDAVYVQQSIGTRQKILFADHDPLPVIFSPEFLRERGLEPKELTQEQQTMLQERYGRYKT